MATIAIRNKKKRIHIMFRWNGIQYNLGTDFYCTREGKKNCTCKSCHNGRLMAKSVQDELDRGKFVMSDFFPEHPDSGVVNVSDNILFTVFMSDFIYNGAFQYSTLRNYKSMVNIMTPHFKGLLIGDVTKAHVRRYRDLLKKEGISNKTINNRLGLLSSVFKYAIESRLISENPASDLFLKVKKPQMLPFTPKEVKQILDDIDKHHPKITLFFAVGFYTGMRTGEILAINKEDFDLEDHKINVSKTITDGRFKNSTKTGEDRFVDILEALDPYIKRHFEFMETQERNPNGYLFVNQYQKRIVGYQTIAEMYWRPCLKRLGIEYRQPYHMRHTFACQNIAAGEDLNWIKDMLGHETLEMLLKTYGKWFVRKEGRAGGKFMEYLEHEQQDYKEDNIQETVD